MKKGSKDNLSCVVIAFKDFTQNGCLNTFEGNSSQAFIKSHQLGLEESSVVPKLYRCQSSGLRSSKPPMNKLRIQTQLSESYAVERAANKTAIEISSTKTVSGLKSPRKFSKMQLKKK